MNAASIAEERGIRVTERKKPRDPGFAATNVLRMTFKSGQQENTVAGCGAAGRTRRGCWRSTAFTSKRRWRATSFTCAISMCPA